MAGMLQNMDKIMIYPEHMEIFFGYAKLIELPDTDMFEKLETDSLKISYGDRFDYRRRKQAEQETVVEMMRQNPVRRKG